MEPWDGPASIAFTDGTVIGAVLDRNGLRPSPLLGHRRRPRRHGVRGRRAADRPGRRSCRRAGSSPAACSWSTPNQGRIVDDDEIKEALAAAAALRRVAPRRPRAPRRPARPRLPHAAARVGRQAPAGVRLHHRGAEDPPRPRWPAPAPSRSARWAPTRRSPCSPTGPACCSTTSSSCSRRSPTRRSTPSARSWSPRWARPLGPEGNLLEPRPRRRAARSCCPSPILTNDGAGQAPLHQRRRRHARLQAVRHRRPLPGGRGRRGPAPGARGGPRQGHRGHRRRRQAHRPLRPPLDRRAGADPVAAAHRRRCTTT